MIKGVHAMFYSSDPEATRSFLANELGLPNTDVGGGWLIYDFAEADMGVHPTDFEGSPPTGTHAISMYCDNIEETVAALEERGVEFDQGIEDQGYGLVTSFTMPGDVRVELYEPKYK